MISGSTAAILLERDSDSDPADNKPPVSVKKVSYIFTGRGSGGGGSLGKLAFH